MAKVAPAVYRSSEHDWPVLLHVTVCSRKRSTVASIRYADTYPPNPPEARLKASYESDRPIRTPRELLAVLDVLKDQLLRQIAVLERQGT